MPVAAEQIAQRWAYYAGKCWICGARAEQTDHVKPISKGGAHMPCNLRPICTSCNASKNNKWPFDPKQSPTPQLRENLKAAA